MGERRAVPNNMASAYRRGSRPEKSSILDQLVALTGWNRDYARAKLRDAGEIRVVRVRRARTPVYSPAVVSALELCWRVARAPAGKRLAPMPLVLVPLLRRDGELELTDDEAELLMKMSAATIDRRLQGAKVLAQFRGRSHTKPGSLLKSQIPIRTWSEWDEGVPGFVEIDLVGHEGGNSFGEFCFSLTMTDIATGWTVNRSVPNKSAIGVVDAIEHVRRAFPFPILGLRPVTLAAKSNHKGASMIAAVVLASMAFFPARGISSGNSALESAHSHNAPALSLLAPPVSPTPDSATGCNQFVCIQVIGKGLYVSSVSVYTRTGSTIPAGDPVYIIVNGSLTGNGGSYPSGGGSGVIVYYGYSFANPSKVCGAIFDTPGLPCERVS